MTSSHEVSLGKLNEGVSMNSLHFWLWQYGLWSFQTEDTKLERFLPKNQRTQRKLLNFEFWINGELSKIGHLEVKFWHFSTARH